MAANPRPPSTGPSRMPDDRGRLKLDGVSKRFGSVVAVDDVSLDLPAGAFLSLLGPSGCGKTTLLRIIAGLERLDAGSILVDGQDITMLPPERRPFNMVFQRYALFPHLTVAENVAFGLTTDRRARPSADELERRVDQMLNLVGLESFGKRHPNQLSGGQAQRVAVARALVRQPRVLLLDEPMAALDRNVRHQVREELLRIHNELGTTFLLVTHDQDEALSISELVGLMHDGRLVQLADPQTLYRHPATLFAARFVGAGSFLGGEVVQARNGSADVDISGIRFSTRDAGIRGARSCTVLLRPEDLMITDAGSGRIDGRVETCAFFGSYFEITVVTKIGPIRLHSPQSRSPGTDVGISWPTRAGAAYPAEADETQ